MCKKKLTAAGVSRSDKSPVFKINLIIVVSETSDELVVLSLQTCQSARQFLVSSGIPDSTSLHQTQQIKNLR